MERDWMWVGHLRAIGILFLSLFLLFTMYQFVVFYFGVFSICNVILFPFHQPPFF